MQENQIKLIEARFQPQAWVNNTALNIDDGTADFEVTERVLGMDLHELHALEDFRSSTKTLVNGLHRHKGPFVVSVTYSVCQFFDVLNCREITPAMFSAVRQGIEDGRESPDELSMGMSYNDRHLSELYDQGVNLGQLWAQRDRKRLVKILPVRGADAFELPAHVRVELSLDAAREYLRLHDLVMTEGFTEIRRPSHEPVYGFGDEELEDVFLSLEEMETIPLDCEGFATECDRIVIGMLGVWWAAAWRNTDVELRTDRIEIEELRAFVEGNS